MERRKCPHSKILRACQSARPNEYLPPSQASNERVLAGEISRSTSRSDFLN